MNKTDFIRWPQSEGGHEASAKHSYSAHFLNSQIHITYAMYDTHMYA